MGNAIAKKFNLPKEHTATAGHVNNWKIWPGKSKDSGGQLVSIWAFDKTDLTKRKLNPVADKAIVEQVFQIMKKDFTVIKDSKACSNIIQIIEVVEDSKNGIAFTTERIVCSLADIMNNFENVPGGAAEHANFFEAGGALSEMEISRGLLNIALAVQYLHTVQRKLHLNVTPENIVITATGQWKLCGFGFTLNFVQGDQQRLASPYFLQSYPIVTTSLVSRLEPDLRYAGPECTDGGLNPPGVRYLTPVADVFSMGLTFYEIYRYCMKLTGSERGYHKPLVPVTNNDAQQHHAALNALQSIDLTFLPGGVITLLTAMLQMNVNLRATTADIVSNGYFVTGTQAVLNMVETMHTRDLGTQSSQLLSLQPELANFPGRMLIHSILPAMSRLCLASPNLWVYAMPLHAELARLLPEDKYMYFAGPYLAQGLNTPDLPNETLQVFLASAEFLCRTFGSEFFQANVTTLFCAALDKPNLYLQNLALEKLAEHYVHSLFTAPTLVERMIPQLCKQACKNTESTVKIQCLYIISLVTFKLDESYIAANVLTSLKYITDHEKNPLVSMSVVGNFDSISNSLGLQYVATSILPILQGMLLDDGLDKNQFEMVVNMIKRLLRKILDKRTAELGIAPIGVAEVAGSEAMDPFANAKSLIAQSKERNIASNYGMVAGSYKSFSTDRTYNSSNVSANSAYIVTAPTRATHGPAAVLAPAPSPAPAPAPVQNGYFDGAAQLGPPPATYGSLSATPAAAPAAPTRAPPPLPSAPPPSHAPPPVPAPGVVGGFGANVGPAATGYGIASSAAAPALGSYTSSLSAPAGTTNSAYGSNPYGAASIASTAPQPTLSAYQSSFASTGSLSSTASSAGFGTPLKPLDSGLPGYGGSASTNAGGVPSVYNANAPAFVAPAVTSLSSGPLGEEEKKSSVFGWFTGSKKSAATGAKESLMDSSPADLYQPPVVPNAASAYTGPSTSGVGGAGYGSSGLGGAGYGAGSGISAGPDDLDDFLSSFGKSAAPSTMGASSAPSSAYSSNATTTTAAPAGAAFSTNPAPAFRSSFGASTGSYSPAPVAGSYTPSPTPGSAVSAAGSTAGMSIEQQIAAAQAEIARLSTNQAPAQSFGYGGAAPMGNPAAGAGMQGMGAGGYGGGAPAYGYPSPQGALPQQGYYGNANMNNMGGMPGAGGYAPPQAQSGVTPGYSYNAQGSNQMNNMQRGGPGMQPQMGFAAPNAGGYQPPMAGASMPGGMAGGQAKAKTSDVFDFLN